MSAHLFRILLLLSLLLALFDLAWIWQIHALTPTAPTGPGFIKGFYPFTFTHFEPLALITTLAFFISLALFRLPRDIVTLRLKQVFFAPHLPFYAAAIFLVVACLGRLFIDHNFDLCVDEFLPEFEVQILKHHQLVAQLPTEWVADQYAMSVPFQIYHPQSSHSGYWASGFLPGFALLDLLFDSLNLGWAIGATLGAVSLLLVAALARRAFPQNAQWAAALAVLLLAFSPQFFIMALTRFSWPAHLCGTLLWVWLFTHPDKRLFYLTPILGMFLIGLHQLQVHFLVALPFLLRLVATLNWRACLWFAIWYGLGIYIWWQIFVLLRAAPASALLAAQVASPATPWSNAVSIVLHTISVPNAISVISAICHSVTLYAWMTPILLPFFALGALTLKRQPPLILDSFLAVALTFLFYLCFPNVQGHGWGFRFLHSAYGLLVLVGTAGGVTVYQQFRSNVTFKIVLFSVLFSLIVQIPYRCFEVSTLVLPFAKIWSFISTRPTDFVIVESAQIWYGADLIRNDPYLQKKPLIFDAARLTSQQRRDLYTRGTVTVVGASEVRQFGGFVSDLNNRIPTSADGSNP